MFNKLKDFSQELVPNKIGNETPDGVRRTADFGGRNRRAITYAELLDSRNWVANKGYWDSGNGPYALNTSLHNLETIEWNEVLLPGVHPPIDFQDFVHNKEESHKPDKVNWQKEGF